MIYHKLEAFCDLIKAYLFKKYGYTEAQTAFYPLAWYVQTDRASRDFIEGLLTKKPFMIARLLHEGGSVDEAIERLKAYVLED